MEGEESTLILIEDSNFRVFGAFCGGGQWAVQPYFFGNGETFLFKFSDTEHIKVFRWAGQNEFFRYAAKTAIGFGGSSASVQAS